jgi:hypothetical protein
MLTTTTQLREIIREVLADVGGAAWTTWTDRRAHERKQRTDMRYVVFKIDRVGRDGDIGCVEARVNVLLRMRGFSNRVRVTSNYKVGGYLRANAKLA